MVRSVSLVVTTYNWPAALELCLKSAFNQTRLPNEIIIGDDGSRPETVAVIDKLRLVSPIKIIHVWQEDKGFRLAKIRNKAIMASSHDYIIQIDGDIIMHPRFIEDHMRLARPGFCLRGGRAMLDKELTKKLCGTKELIAINFWTNGIESNRLNTIHSYWLSSYLASRYAKKRYVLGCNMSFYKSNFLALNGYDENFEGWGYEDTDFFRRLLMLGIRKRHLKFAGLAYHLWHEHSSSGVKDKNGQYCFRKNISVYCKNGAIKED